MRERRSAHEPGRVIRERAVMLAAGGDCLADLRAVRNQWSLFAEVASDSTAWRVVAGVARGPELLGALASLARLVVPDND